MSNNPLSDATLANLTIAERQEQFYQYLTDMLSAEILNFIKESFPSWDFTNFDQATFNHFLGLFVKLMGFDHTNKLKRFLELRSNGQLEEDEEYFDQRSTIRKLIVIFAREFEEGEFGVVAQKQI